MAEQWKLLDLIERMASTKAEDLIQDETMRVAGRLEAKGFRKVRAHFTEDNSHPLGPLIKVELHGYCPCGASRIGSAEFWTREVLGDGPHRFLHRLRTMEDAFMGKLGEAVEK